MSKETEVRSQETGGEQPLEVGDVMALQNQEFVFEVYGGLCVCGCGTYGLELNGKQFQLSPEIAKKLGTSLLDSDGKGAVNSEMPEGQAPQAARKVGDKCELDGTEERISELAGGLVPECDRYMWLVNGKTYVASRREVVNMARSILMTYERYDERNQ